MEALYGFLLDGFASFSITVAAVIFGLLGSIAVVRAAWDLTSSSTTQAPPVKRPEVEHSAGMRAALRATKARADV